MRVQVPLPQPEIESLVSVEIRGFSFVFNASRVLYALIYDTIIITYEGQISKNETTFCLRNCLRNCLCSVFEKLMQG